MVRNRREDGSIKPFRLLQSPLPMECDSRAEHLRRLERFVVAHRHAGIYPTAGLVKCCAPSNSTSVSTRVTILQSYRDAACRGPATTASQRQAVDSITSNIKLVR